MKSFKLLTSITHDKEYKKDEIITEKQLGSYLNYFDSIGVLEFVKEEVKEEVILPEEVVDEKTPEVFQKAKKSN